MKTADIHEKVRLSTRISEFSYFAPDQVLTAGQLNQLIQYLDYQDRSTRAWLTGSGLICGYSHEVTKTSLELEAGCAITSDGDLVAIPQDAELTHVRVFKDEDAKYFGKKGTGIASFEPEAKILELLTTEQAKREEEAKKLEPETMSDRVLVLYLESFAKEPEFCTGDNCDNKGPVQHNNIRVLALPLEAVKPLASDLSDLANQLKPVAVSRPSLDSGIKKLEGANQFQDAFTTSIKGTRTALLRELQKIDKVFEVVLAPYGFVAAPAWKAGLKGSTLNPGTEIKGLLHYYGFYRDFCRAYREWRDTLFALRPGHCGIRPLAHPKHILLGVVGKRVTCTPTPHRHRFYRATAIAGCGDELDRSRLLWQRLVAMVETFTPNPVVATKPAVSGVSGLNEKIRITPSAACDRPLGEHSVPIFLGRRFDPPWDVDARLQCRFESPVSYYSNGEHAFGFSLCERPFYRIEGHLGEPLEDVLETLQKLRAHYNICFNILTVQIEDDPDKVRKLPWRFFDIETLYYGYRTEFKLRFRDIKDYSKEVLDTLEEEEDLVPDRTKASRAREAAGFIQEQSTVISDKLPGKFSKFTTTSVKSFLSDYGRTVTQGHKLTKNTYSYSGNLQLTPIERFVQPELPSKFATLRDLLTKRRRKAAELTTFQKFVEKHPGLEHLGGVPKGGTIILVYSTDKQNRQTVKADLALPYFCELNLDQLEEEEEPADFETPIPENKPAPPIYKPRKWLDDYNWKVFDVRTPKLNDKIKAIEDGLKNIRETTIPEFEQKYGDKFKDYDSRFDFYIPKGGRTTTPSPDLGLGGGAMPGVGGGGKFGPHGGKIEEAAVLNEEIIRKRTEIAEHGETPARRNRLAELENEQAKKLNSIGVDLAKSMAADEKAGKPTSTEDRRTLAFIHGASAEIEAAPAKETFATGMEKAVKNVTAAGVKDVFRGFKFR